jgi:hypothetical protein
MKDNQLPVSQDRQKMKIVRLEAALLENDCPIEDLSSARQNVLEMIAELRKKLRKN